MAKTYSDLFSGIVDFEALHQAWNRVRRGRRSQGDVLAFERELEPNLIDIQNSLIWKTYRTGPYRRFRVFEPKERLIGALPLKDRIVQHALVAMINPIWESRFIHDSYACRPGKGAHAGADRAQMFLRQAQREHGCAYVLKADISKYFASIPHDALKRLLRRRIACADTLWLIDEIIDSIAEPNDPLPRGISIGNLTSQLFANIFLHELDEHVKHELKEPRYLRYMDDFAVIGGDKAHLHDLRRSIEGFLYAHLGLRLNAKTQVFPVSIERGRALDFLGYRIWPTHRKLRRDSVRRMRRKLKRLARLYHEGRVDLAAVDRVVMSWIGHASHADTWRLRGKVLGSVAFVPPAVSRTDSPPPRMAASEDPDQPRPEPGQ